jgi:tRNA/tmRNA/rRNA uracil-C5-methylase (TrmA/RlmC/RlmD family)
VSRHGQRRPRPAPLTREPVEAVIDGFTHGGEGVARVEGKAVFVPGALPGERVVLRVVDDRARWARAELVEVREASPDRVEPPCPYVPACGGCDLQHASPEAQRRLKTRVVREQLERLGGVADPPVVACRAVGPDTGYRTHAQLHAAPDGRLGFHRAGSHEVVPVARCLVLTEAAQAVRDQVGDDTGAAEVAVRAHPASGTAAAVLTPGPGGLALPEGAFDLLLEQPDGSLVTMRGDGSLAEQVGPFTFRFDAGSFFQVNSAGAAALSGEVREACGDVGGALVWDLYAGVGLLSLPLAADGAEVVAVEGHRPSAEHARANAEAAGLDLEVLAEPVEDVVRRAAAGAAELDPPDIVVLDPPRTGAGPDVVTDIAALAPGLIAYVACDVAALARDTRALGEHGYRLTRAVPLDLFPMTHHVEVVATFVR